MFSCHLLRFVLSFGELMSRGEIARRNFRQLVRVVRRAKRIERIYFAASTNSSAVIPAFEIKLRSVPRATCG